MSVFSLLLLVHFHSLWYRPDLEVKGLEKVAKDLIKASNGRMSEQLSKIIAPERKLVAMIIGNHSAGKSSFINWYVEEDIQRAKVSIETIEINLIMHGR